MSKSINLDLNLIADEAISDLEHDSLDFNAYSEVITEAILKTPTPFTVGIFSEAGKGKTSLMKFIQKQIALTKNDDEKIISLFFNAWKFENDEHPLLDLCSAVERTIQKNRNNFDEDVVVNILDYIKYLKYAVANIKIQLDTIKTNETTDNIDENLEKHLLNQSTFFQIFELLKGLEKILNEENFKIVIFIDDLDKCLPKNAVKLLESINLVLDLKGLSFVLAADREILENFLEDRRKSKFDENSEQSGKTYLDKMVQLPFYLPSYNGKISNLIDNIYAKTNTSDTLEDSIKNVILSISSLDNITPRFIIRLINRIKVSSKIFMKINPNTTLKHDVIYSLFAISCTLEELYNDIYQVLVKNDPVVKYLIKTIQHETYIKEDSSLHLNINKTQKEQLLQVLENDYDALRMIFSTEQGKYWLEHRKFRVETFEFLHSNSFEEVSTSTPVYKTDFEDTIVLIDDKDVNEKEFIKIPNQNFEMSKYVITNKWFNEFIDSNGYTETKFWTDMASKIWLMNNKVSSLDEKYEEMLEKEKNYYKKKYKQNLLKENFNKDLQPVVYVTYYEAKAFCNYLSSIDDEYNYDIPSKEQWDYVARAGEEERLFPWGNTWNKNYCNNSSNQLHKTSEIGAFPQGNSKFGISDMVGNVWSWTSSLEKNEYNYLKGGSWNFADSSYFKVSNNKMTFFNNPSFQYYDIGFFCIRTKK
ncbi:P-loop NTPase fold protein [Arcobacter sp. LA11]|uniref:P-loop NTPase fold protein n=1 Tax=Arcobacter sp. LA11 TaxID=1898176 RepID=UPI00093440B4|nr:P-loop NTPase fold protein [Arcobacter sp. LA11]